MVINDEYQIVSDPLNWILQKKVKGRGSDSKDTECKYRDVGYFPNPNMALKYMIDSEIRGTGLEDFETVINKIEELHKIIKNIKIK